MYPCFAVHHTTCTVAHIIIFRLNLIKYIVVCRPLLRAVCVYLQTSMSLFTLSLEGGCLSTSTRGKVDGVVGRWVKGESKSSALGLTCHHQTQAQWSGTHRRKTRLVVETLLTFSETENYGKNDSVRKQKYMRNANNIDRMYVCQCKDKTNYVKWRK